MPRPESPCTPEREEEISVIKETGIVGTMSRVLKKEGLSVSPIGFPLDNPTREILLIHTLEDPFDNERRLKAIVVVNNGKKSFRGAQITDTGEIVPIGDLPICQIKENGDSDSRVIEFLASLLK